MNIFFTSDTHFGHNNVIKFCKRPFDTVEDMDEELISNWNSVVNKGDRVYHLGDFAWTTKRAKEVRPRLNGNIRLVVGNHDQIMPLALSKIFQRMYLWRSFRDLNFVATHVPLSKDEMREVDFNVHGHKHNDPTFFPEAHHINVCTELTNYTPISVETLIEKMKENK